MATIYDIAKVAKVSPTTVSQVLNGRRQMKWPSKMAKAQRILDVAEQLGYKPHSGARSLRCKSTRHIGVLLMNSPARPLHYPASFEYVMGMNRRLEEEGYVLSIVRVSDLQQDEYPESLVFRERMLEGMIVINQVNDEVTRRISDLVKHIVWLDGPWTEYDSVRRNEIAAGRMCAEALIQAGYRRLVFLAGRRGDNEEFVHYSVVDRLKGVTDTASAAGLPVETIAMPRHTARMPEELVSSLSKAGTGIIAYGATFAVRAGHHLAGRGLVAGKDVGLASCEITMETIMALPELSHVEFDRFSMGRMAAELMLAKLGDKPTKSVCHQDAWNPGNTISHLNSDIYTPDSAHSMG